jgi:hypothetical protein
VVKREQRGRARLVILIPLSTVRACIILVSVRIYSGICISATRYPYSNSLPVWFLAREAGESNNIIWNPKIQDNSSFLEFIGSIRLASDDRRGTMELECFPQSKRRIQGIFRFIVVGKARQLAHPGRAMTMVGGPEKI